MLKYINKSMRRGFSFGIGLLAAFCMTALVAATVSGIIHIFSPGQAVSSSQVNQNFASLRAAIEGIDTVSEYSTAETATNKTWIDGKTIYRKVLVFGALPDNATVNYPHAITGLDTIVHVQAFAVSRNTKFFYKIPATSGGGGISVEVGIDGTNAVVTTLGTWSNNYDFTFYIEYTKL